MAGEGGGGDDLDFTNTTAGGSRRPVARKPVAAPPPSQPIFDPMAAFNEMMKGFGESQGGSHQPSGPTGPTDEEIEADRRTGGLNDLDKAYGGYITASETATDYVNTQIGNERSNAALMGIVYNVTDEAKTQRISDYFSTIYSAEDYTKLTGLNDDFGEYREGDPLEFLIQRGVPADAEPETKDGGHTATNPIGTIATAPKTEDPLGTAALTSGG